MNTYSQLPLPYKMMTRLIWGAGKIGLSKQIGRLFIKKGNKNREPRERRSFKGYTPSAHDILVCTYEKSGTNWALQIVHQIAHRGEGDFENIHFAIPWPDSPIPFPLPTTALTDPITSPTGLRAIKTHNVQQNVPMSPQARYVVVLRDPKDMFVSLYHFFHSNMRCLIDVTFPPEEWLTLFLNDRLGVGSWAKHTASWWAVRHQSNVLVLTFDQMKKDLAGTVDQIADLMGVSLTEQQREAVIERASFSYMKAHNQRFTPPMPRLRDHTPVMIRSGKSGGSSELLSSEQQARIDTHCAKALRDLGSDFVYPDDLYTP